MLAHVCIILLACDQIRAPLYLCTKVVPDTPALLIGRSVCRRCGKRDARPERRMKTMRRGSGGRVRRKYAVFMLFMASSPQ